MNYAITIIKVRINLQKKGAAKMETFELAENKIKEILLTKKCVNLKGNGWSKKQTQKNEFKENSQVIRYVNKDVNFRATISNNIIGKEEMVLTFSVNKKKWHFCSKDESNQVSRKIKTFDLKGTLEELKYFIILVDLKLKDNEEDKGVFKKLLSNYLKENNLSLKEKERKNVYQNKNWLEFRERVLSQHNNNCYCKENVGELRPFIYQSEYNPKEENYNAQNVSVCCDHCQDTLLEKDLNEVKNTFKETLNNKETELFLTEETEKEFEILNDKEKKSVNKIDLVGCEMCGRTRKKDGVVLQVHHKHYDENLEVYQYERSDLMVICKGCHVREHGLLEPNNGWILSDKYDNEDLSGECNRQKTKIKGQDDLCDQAIRYEHYLHHPKGFHRTVGSTCVQHMVLTQNSDRIFKSLNETPEKIISKRLSEDKYIKMTKKPFSNHTNKCKDYNSYFQGEAWSYESLLSNDKEEREINAYISLNINGYYSLSLYQNNKAIQFKKASDSFPQNEIVFGDKNSLNEIKKLLISYTTINKEIMNGNDHLVVLWKEYIKELKIFIFKKYQIEISNDDTEKAIETEFSDLILKHYMFKYFSKPRFKKQGSVRYRNGEQLYRQQRFTIKTNAKYEEINIYKNLGQYGYYIRFSPTPNIKTGLENKINSKGFLNKKEEIHLDYIVFFLDYLYELETGRKISAAKTTNNPKIKDIIIKILENI